MADNKQETPQVYHLVALEFVGKDRAMQVIDLVRGQQSKETFKVQAWAVVEVDERGKAEVKQSGNGGKGAAIGAGTGVLLGLIGGPAGLLVWALGGTLLGGLIGKSSGHAFDKDQLKAIAAGMVPNSSAIVAIIEDREMEKAAAEAGEMGAKVVTVTLGDQMSGEVAQYAAIDLGKEGPDAEAPATGEAPAADAAPAAKDAPAAS
jgi:uncharacterized membrane protein